MSLEQALLDRLEKRSLQIAQQKNEIYGLWQLVNEKMAINEQLYSEVARLRAEVPLESTREGLKNAVAKLQEVTTEKDRMRLQLENARADLKQALVERDSLGSMAADRVMEIRKLMDGHAEDMKAQAELTAQLDSTKGEAEEWLKQCHAARRQRDEVKEEARKETQRLSDLCAELQSKYESLLAKTTDLGSYAMNGNEHVAQFIDRIKELLDLSCRERITGENEIAQLNAKVGPLEKLYEVVKKHVDHGAIIDNRADIYDAVAETAKALSQLTA